MGSFYHIWAWRPTWSGVENHLNKLLSPTLSSLHFKFEFNWPSDFRGCLKVLTNGWTPDGATENERRPCLHLNTFRMYVANNSYCYTLVAKTSLVSSHLRRCLKLHKSTRGVCVCGGGGGRG